VGDARYDYFCWAPDKGSAQALIAVLESRGLTPRRKPYRMESGGYGVHVGGPLWYIDPSLARHDEITRIAAERGCEFDGGGTSVDALTPGDFPDDMRPTVWEPNAVGAVATIFEAGVLGSDRPESAAAAMLDAVAGSPGDGGVFIPIDKEGT
jgi:hypothetical protein